MIKLWDKYQQKRQQKIRQKCLEFVTFRFFVEKEENCDFIIPQVLKTNPKNNSSVSLM